MVKGPLKLTDMILWHMGWGMHMSPPGAFRMTHDVRKKVPGMFPKDPMGIPDTVQRCHWQPDWAQRLGFLTAYDYGAQREVWFSHLISNWMGDDAWLWKLTAKHHKFNFHGDTTWMTGEVTAKEELDGHKAVRINLTATNRAEETSSSGHAVVLLPSRRDGLPNLPAPPAPDLSGLNRASGGRVPGHLRLTVPTTKPPASQVVVVCRRLFRNRFGYLQAVRGTGPSGRGGRSRPGCAGAAPCRGVRPRKPARGSAGRCRRQLGGQRLRRPIRPVRRRGCAGQLRRPSAASARWRRHR